jgi:hypothetical protein
LALLLAGHLRAARLHLFGLADFFTLFKVGKNCPRTEAGGHSRRYHGHFRLLPPTSRNGDLGDLFWKSGQWGRLATDGISPVLRTTLGYGTWCLETVEEPGSHLRDQWPAHLWIPTAFSFYCCKASGTPFVRCLYHKNLEGPLSLPPVSSQDALFSDPERPAESLFPFQMVWRMTLAIRPVATVGNRREIWRRCSIAIFKPRGSCFPNICRFKSHGVNQSRRKTSRRSSCELGSSTLKASGANWRTIH